MGGHPLPSAWRRRATQRNPSTRTGWGGRWAAGQLRSAGCTESALQDPFWLGCFVVFFFHLFLMSFVARQVSRRWLWILKYISFQIKIKNRFFSPHLLFPRARTVPENRTRKLPEVSQPGRAARSWQRVPAVCAVATVPLDGERWGGPAALAQSWCRRWPGKQFILDRETHFMKGPAAATDSGLDFSIT